MTGDCHGDFNRFATKNFPQLKEMDWDVLLSRVILGVYGPGSWWMGTKEDKPFTTLFVDENHENFDLLNAYPEQQWHGGRVQMARPHILRLMRGQIYEIGGLTWFTMGSAASHDIDDGILDPVEPNFEYKYWRMKRMGAYFRVLGQSWWPEEMPSEAEYAEAEANLERAGWTVDCVRTHCAPTSVTKVLDPSYQPDKLTDFLKLFADGAGSASGSVATTM